jgi:hypothetical protein
LPHIELESSPASQPLLYLNAVLNKAELQSQQNPALTLCTAPIFKGAADFCGHQHEGFFDFAKVAAIPLFSI